MTTTRRLVQFGFLVLTLVGVFGVRGNAERWCPFGGVEAVYTYVREGNLLCSLGVSNFYILGGVLAATLLLRRAFCGYICPIGTVSEWVQRGAARMGLHPLRVPYRLDRGLALLKYTVLGIILWATYQTGELLFRGYDPCYALLSRHGDDITAWAYIVAGAVIGGSLLLTLSFCRWLCPLAAVLHPFSRFGLTRIQRDHESCVGCAECARACPMAIPVDRVPRVTAARCLSCLNCVEACTQHAAGALRWGPPRLLGRAWPQGALIGILLACVTSAVAATYVFPLPSFVKTRGDAPAQTATLRLQVRGLTCRGKATLFAYFVERDDEYELPGYLKIEAWPGPGLADARITYPPCQISEERIRRAITEPYFDGVQSAWHVSPFEIAGYDPLGLNPP
ncbi:MAG: 4Fe-4S binding protein [Planctomycetota bacterium]